MLSSLSLAFSIIAVLALYILFNFAEKKLSLLESPELLHVIHIKEWVLIKNKKYKKPILINDILQAIELIEDPSLKKEISTSINNSIASLDEKQKSFVYKDKYTIILN